MTSPSPDDTERIPRTNASRNGTRPAGRRRRVYAVSRRYDDAGRPWVRVHGETVIRVADPFLTGLKIAVGVAVGLLSVVAGVMVAQWWVEASGLFL